MASIWVELLTSLGPIIIFVILMVIVWYRGTRQNKALLEKLEGEIKGGLLQRGIEYERVKIRDNEYEYRCRVKGQGIRILTLHLKLVNRSFIVQWIINLLFKEKEKLFIGSKFSGSVGDEDPVYRFDVVPYRNKSYITRRFEEFVEFDDIPTDNKNVNKLYMIKSQSASYVKHFIDNKDIVKLLEQLEPNIEHISLRSAKEGTDPHLAATYVFHGMKNPPIINFLRLFFLITDNHHKNHDGVKKLIAKGKKGRYGKRGSAKRGAGKAKKRKKANKPKR